MRVIKLILKRIMIGVSIALAYVIIGAMIFFKMEGSSDNDYFTFLGIWLVLGILLLIFTPMRYALIFTVFIGIGTDIFSDIGTDSSMDISADLDVSTGEENVGSVIDQVKEPGTHYVDQQYVSGYVREDGTVVEGYWRDGFERSNPDVSSLNNIKKGT